MERFFEGEKRNQIFYFSKNFVVFKEKNYKKTKLLTMAKNDRFLNCIDL